MTVPDNLEIRLAQADDLAWCVQTDLHVPEEVLRRKIELHEVILAEVEDRIIGCLRLEYLWSLVPYISVIYVWEDYQRRGVGRAILEYAQELLVGKGHKVLLSSSSADEPAPQAWHRAVGFRECGFIAGINEDGIGEVFFRKELLTGVEPSDKRECPPRA